MMSKTKENSPNNNELTRNLYEYFSEDSKHIFISSAKAAKRKNVFYSSQKQGFLNLIGKKTEMNDLLKTGTLFLS